MNNTGKAPNKKSWLIPFLVALPNMGIKLSTKTQTKLSTKRR